MKGKKIDFTVQFLVKFNPFRKNDLLKMNFNSEQCTKKTEPNPQRSTNMNLEQYDLTIPK